MVTIVERLTLKTLSAHIDGKRAHDITMATIKLLKPYKDLVHSITADIGKEFSEHEKVAAALDADVYFAHHYSALGSEDLMKTRMGCCASTSERQRTLRKYRISMLKRQLGDN